ncbi:hypothetical protein SUGI_0177150 [Cryptomeria japonica]|nr:hypothetical protein SUGI_0177150 [Cryptomeria japonica]
MEGRAGRSLMAEGSGGSADKALDISPLSFVLPPEHIAARKKTREYREYHRERYSQIKEGAVKGNDKPTIKIKEQLAPEITKHEVPRYRSSEDAEVLRYRGSEHAKLPRYRGSEDAQVLRYRGSEDAEVRRCRGSEHAKVPRYRGSEHAEVPRYRGSEDAEVLRYRGSDHAEVPRYIGSEDAEVLRYRGSEHSKVPIYRGSEHAKVPRYRGSEHAKVPRYRVSEDAEVLRYRGSEDAEVPRYIGSEHAEKRNGGEMDLRDSRLSGNSERKSEGQEMSTEERVRFLLSKYYALLRWLEQKEEAAGRVFSAQSKANLHQEAVNVLRSWWESLPKKHLGHVPGIPVGYEFQSRVMLNMLGMHRPPQAGIDFLGEEETELGVTLVTSILLAGGYEDNIDNGEVIIYTGHGGNDYEKSKKQIKDQELTKGNKALVNSYRQMKPVRVIRKCMSSDRECHSFRYDGLYMVENWWTDKGRSGFWVYKFRLKRQQGQPPLLSNVVQFKRNSQRKNQVAVIKEDIAEGQDKFPIAVVNSVDNVYALGEFKYVRTVKYPKWLSKPAVPEGCRCLEGCTDDKECLCARRNGGKFPYTLNGRLVKSEPVIYECGPCCRCPPSCRNRVSQHGLKYKLDVFRTPRNRWGVRSEDFIEAGDFITEYTGNLIADPTSYASPSEMMFPIASIPMEGNWGDLHGIVEDEDVTVLPSQIVENAGFCVDATTSGNASRFISRNSRPNLCAQYVLYDHHDIRIPHVMIFATENISPKLELSINASVQQNTIKRFCSNHEAHDIFSLSANFFGAN